MQLLVYSHSEPSVHSHKAINILSKYLNLQRI